MWLLQAADLSPSIEELVQGEKRLNTDVDKLRILQWHHVMLVHFPRTRQVYACIALGPKG